MEEIIHSKPSASFISSPSSRVSTETHYILCKGTISRWYKAMPLMHLLLFGASYTRSAAKTISLTSWLENAVKIVKIVKNSIAALPIAFRLLSWGLDSSYYEHIHLLWISNFFVYITRCHKRGFTVVVTIGIPTTLIDLLYFLFYFYDKGQWLIQRYIKSFLGTNVAQH